VARRERSDSQPLGPALTDIILESIADGAFTIDTQWRVTSFNLAAEEITGIPREEAIGRPCCEVFRANVCETDCVLRKTFQTDQPIINKPVYVVRADGKKIPIQVSTAILRDGNGQPVGGVETFRDLSTVEELRKALRNDYSFEDMVSQSEGMHRIFALLPQIAESGSTVLVEGESGTGKELVARAIHRLSPVGNGPFVAVNCAALPDTLLESELFGYKAGAFTDAKKDKPGRFAQATGGTLFLDEIGDVSPATQGKLLRVLQEKTFEPLGSVHSEKAEVRLVAATNKDLRREVEEGRFREDLFYRVHVMRLNLPPLRERKEDIPVLVDHFLDRLQRIKGKRVEGVSQEALAMLIHHPWPGNVRELENVLEVAYVLCPPGESIRPEHVRDNLVSGRVPWPALTLPLTLRDIERQAIEEALLRNRGRIVATARQLGIDKNTLRRKMIRLEIPHPRQTRGKA
jgi:PAS domain S-box-containing protein